MTLHDSAGSPSTGEARTRPVGSGGMHPHTGATRRVQDAAAPPKTGSPREQQEAQHEHARRGSSWLLVRGIRLTIDRVRSQWQALPARAWKAWLVILTVGWLLAGLLAYGVSYAAKQMTGGGTFAGEQAYLTWIVDTFPLDLVMAHYLGVPGDSVFLFVLVPSAALLAIWAGHLLRGLTILISLLWTDVVVGVSWLAWNRARPDFIYDGVATPPLHSFPSGHVTQAIAIYGLLAYLWIAATRSRGEQALAVVLAVLIVANTAITRLEIGTHWPSDIVAALVIGLFWLAFMIAALRRAESLAGPTHKD